MIYPEQIISLYCWYLVWWWKQEAQGTSLKKRLDDKCLITLSSLYRALSMLNNLKEVLVEHQYDVLLLVL